MSRTDAIGSVVAATNAPCRKLRSLKYGPAVFPGYTINSPGLIKEDKANRIIMIATGPQI